MVDDFSVCCVGLRWCVNFECEVAVNFSVVQSSLFFGCVCRREEISMLLLISFAIYDISCLLNCLINFVV